ncbi:MAG: hypothetical protein QM626_09905, partial [Microbacterium sp.]
APPAPPAQPAYAAPSAPGYAASSTAPPYAPGPPPQPGYAAAPQQPGYAPARPSRKGLWIGLGVGGGVLVLAGIIVAVLVIVSLVKGATSAPEQALNDYNSAWMTGDCGTIERLTTSDWKDEWSFSCSDTEANAADPPQSWHMTVTHSSVSGDEADIDYTLSGVDSDGSSFSGDYSAVLVQTGGTWLIDEDDYVG